MKTSLLSFGAGLVVGVVYSLLGVRSPAPPVIALIGLLGILLGEQLVPVGRQMIAGASMTAAWQQMRCGQIVLGATPDSHAAPPAATTPNGSSLSDFAARSDQTGSGPAGETPAAGLREVQS